MTAIKPWRTTEPRCVHSGTAKRTSQPASACRTCSQDPELARWKADWAAWLAENPDSPEARWLAAGSPPGPLPS